jgi:ribosomal protein S18
MTSLEAITDWVLEPENIDFLDGLEHLKQYVHKNGHARVPKNHKTSSGFKLGFWVTRKRWEYNKRILSANEIKAMEEICGLVWDPAEAFFQEAVRHLKEYIHEYGHARVPRRHITSCGFSLGSWIEERCAEYKVKTLSAARVKAFEVLPGWIWNRKEADFLEGIQHLKRYVNEYGHVKVPRSHKTSSDFTLGSWVNFQKRQYKKGTLSAEKIKALEAIPGWISTCNKPV